MMRISMHALLMVAAAVPLAAQTAAHPNFTGTWVLNAPKSDVSPLTPAAAIYTVGHRGDTLEVASVTVNAAGDTLRSNAIRGTDGKPWKNSLSVMGGNVEVTSILTWAQDTLKSQSNFTIQGNDLLQSDRWVLSPDGKVLTISRDVSAGGVVAASTSMVFDKKP